MKTQGGTMNLTQNVLNRLQAGAFVTIVVEPDEVLAMQALRQAGEAFAPKNVTVASVLDGGFLKQLSQFRIDGKGVLIVSDLLRTLGNRPDVPRLVREIALQVRANPVHLILLETPGVEIPAGIKGDIELINVKLPTVSELKDELEQFLKETKYKLEGNGEVRAAIANALAGLARHEAARLLGRCLVETNGLDATWLRKAKAERIQEQSGKVLSFVDVEDAATLGGAEVMQEWLAIAKASFTSDKAKAYGLPEPKGICIVGVPGTGKSLTPKNIARDWGAPLIRLDVGAIFGGVVGQTESNMRSALAAIEACAPCILWIDEVEKALGGKGDGAQGDSGVSTRLSGALLTWMQENKKPVFIVATANSVEQLRAELLRKGRIDDMFFMDLPDLEERVAIAAIHIKLRSRDMNGISKLDPKDVAEASDKFSGAEIEQLLLQAMRKAFAQGRECSIEDIREAAAGTTPLSVMKAKDVTAVRAWAKENQALYANKKAKAAAEEVRGRRLNLGKDEGEGWTTKFEAK